MKFSIPRLGYGISWIEDVLTYHASIYPKRVFEYKTW